MKVSVLMAVYNGESTIRVAVESILKQTYADFEFVIVNDASTDNTLKILNEFQDRRIKIFTNEKNLGQTRSLNKGFNLCKGKYIARMDADDFSYHDRFAKELEVLESEPDIAIVSTSGFMHFSNGWIKPIRRIPKNMDEIRFLSLSQSPIIHISVMINREIINDSFLYDESFKISADWDLWSRLLMAGNKIKVLNERLVWIYISGTTYGKKNSEIESNENERIVKQNLLAFTNYEVTDSTAKELLAFTLYEDSKFMVFLRRLILWFKISLKYRSISRLNFYIYFLRQSLLIIYGFVRRMKFTSYIFPRFKYYDK